MMMYDLPYFVSSIPNRGFFDVEEHNYHRDISEFIKNPNFYRRRIDMTLYNFRCYKCLQEEKSHRPVLERYLDDLLYDNHKMDYDVFAITFPSWSDPNCYVSSCDFDITKENVNEKIVNFLDKVLDRECPEELFRCIFKGLYSLWISEKINEEIIREEIKDSSWIKKDVPWAPVRRILEQQILSIKNFTKTNGGILLNGFPIEYKIDPENFIVNFDTEDEYDYIEYK